MEVNFKQIQNYKSLFESFFSLSVLNGVNVILPLITLPYILRVVGSANYGIYAYVYVLIQYLLLLNNYGFNLSATKQIAENREDKSRLNIIYNSVTACRLLLFLVGVSLFAALSPLLLNTDIKKMMFIMGLGMVLGDVLNPVWLFQGMEKMRYMTIVNLISKLIFTVLIFVFIKKAEDYPYILLINSLGFLLAGIASVIIAKKQFRISFAIPKRKDVCFQFKEGLALFGTSIGTNLYGNANVFILNFFVDSTMVGMYAAAEKVFKGLQAATSSITQALFPYTSKIFFGQTFNFKITKLQYICKILLLLLTIPTIGVFVGADVLIKLLCGTEYETSINLFRIISPVIIIGALNYTLGFIGLVNLNQQKIFLRGVLVSGCISVIFLLVTIPYWGVYSASFAMLLSEIVLLVICLYEVKKLKINNRVNDFQ